MPNILCTGGTGFIGSHTVVELLNVGMDVIIADDLSNSDVSVVDKITQITGRKFKFYQVDVSDRTAMDDLFAKNKIDVVIHFAGFKAVGESVQKPIAYYRNNLDTTLTLLECMQEYNVNRFVFSSSATVYGMCSEAPFIETAAIGGCTNPYGWTKFMIEQILTDAAKSNPEFSVMLLRYFNPVGAHESGQIGEKPNGTPNNLMPYITQVAAGIRKQLAIYGNDYPTHDGTGVRDYIHVVDLAKGHVAAVQYAMTHTGTTIVNLGTGTGYSVLDIVYAFERENRVKIPYVITSRRDGDIATCFADTRKAYTLLKWKAEKTLDDMCRDSWRWQLNCMKKDNR